MSVVRKLNVPLPERFWPTPGQEPTLKWSQWFSQLEDFFHLTDTGLPDTGKLTDTEKNRYLRTLIGSEGLRQFSTHPTCDNVATVTFAVYSEAARSVFSKTPNAIRAHYEFNIRKQGETETIQEFIIALRTIITDCSFFGQEKHFLAVQLATGVHNKETQQKLLSQQTIDLDAFIRIAEADESSSLDSKILRNEDKPSIAAARQSKPWAHKQSRSSKQSQQNKHQGSHAKHSTRQNASKPCEGCGGEGHSHADPKCPALNQQCDGCGRWNHFKKVCRKTGARGVRFLEVDEDTIRSIDHRSTRKSFRCEIRLSDSLDNSTIVKADVDSCSDISGITYQYFQEHFGANPLQSPPTTVRNFDRSVISGIEGYFMVTAEYQGRKSDIRLFVFPNDFGTIFGKAMIQGLQFVLDGDDMHVKAMLNNNDQGVKYKKMIQKYPNLTRDDLGTFPDYKHNIKLKSDAVPCVKRSRPIPLERRDKAMQEIKEMEPLGIWSKVERSDWVHPMVAVGKPDGEVRITTNLIGLNKYVIPFQFPIPNIKEMFLELANAKIFSKLDFKKAYFQITLEEDCRLLTTTDTPLGLYAYNRLVMGLMDSAQAFQFSILLTFSPIPRNLAYIDDDLVHGETVEQHDETLDKVLARANEKDLRLNVEKCQFGVTEVAFLGHVITHGAIKPHPKNVKPIKEYPVPTNVKEVQRFLGMVNYYGSFVPDLATTAELLRKLTRKSIPFCWNDECQAGFDKLRDAVGDTLQLAIFDPMCATIVTTDASDVGIGGVLSQMQDDREVPIAFGHHTLDQSQRNYAAHEREAFAVLYFCEYWDMFLLGRQFVVRTDHQSLQALLQGKTIRQSKKFARWLERLEPFSTLLSTKRARRTQSPMLFHAPWLLFKTANASEHYARRECQRQQLQTQQPRTPCMAS